MSSSYTVLNSGSGGDNIAMEAVTYAAAPNTRKRNHSVITGTVEAAIADVVNADPSGSAYGVTTRSLVLGNVANSAPDAGAPVKVGGKAIVGTPSGAAADANDRVDAWFDRRGALQVFARPPEEDNHTVVLAASGSMAAGLAANSEVLQFRWEDATFYGLLYRITLEYFYSTTAFAAGEFAFDFYAASAWTAAGTGGTELSTSTTGFSQNQLQGSGAQAVIGSDSPTIRVANTAALTAGTKVLNGKPFAGVAGPIAAATGSHIPGRIHIYEVGGTRHPFGFKGHATDQAGFVMRATVPATGVWKFGVSIEWADVSTSRY